MAGFSSATLCACGCGYQADHRHHCITTQVIKRATTTREEYKARCADTRNLLPLYHEHHWAHHARAPKLHVSCLPDSVFAFAYDVLGPGPAYERLIRDYQGEDPRLGALLTEWERDAA